MVSLGRALMTNPRIMLVDEPTIGLAPRVCNDIAAALARLNAETGLTIVITEQNVNFAMSLANRLHVLETGRITEAEFDQREKELLDRLEKLETHGVRIDDASAAPVETRVIPQDRSRTDQAHSLPIRAAPDHIATTPMPACQPAVPPVLLIISLYDRYLYKY